MNPWKTARAHHVNRGTGCCLLILLALIWWAPSVSAADDLITIETQIWGFDGRVQTGQFNPVSFLIDNRTQEAIDVDAVLTRVEGIVGPTGGRIQQPVFIGAGARRWLQFYAYIAADDEAEWQLSLGDQTFRALQQPRSTNSVDDAKSKLKIRPPAVILNAPGSMTLAPVTVKHFAEEIFPPWSTATTGLHTVFMDHEPDWEAPRQQALMSWLRRGGRLHLLKNSRDEWPQFSGGLADLSQPLSRFAVGSGTVQRHDIQRNALSESMVKTALGIDDKKKPDELPEGELTIKTNSYTDQYNQFRMDETDLAWLDQNWFQSMRQLTQPAHAWWLIFILAIIYIGLLFPGCWILARQKRHFVIVYGAIAGLSVVFSLLFLLIGRRGYGEYTVMHSLALSRVEGAGQQSLMDWNALFVTSGDEYVISSKDRQALFAIPSLRQQTNAKITAGNDGQLLVTIPPFSTQAFVSRRQLPLPDWGLAVVSSRSAGNDLADLVIQCGKDFKPGADAIIRLLYGRQMYRVYYDESEREIRQGGRTGPVSKYCEAYYRNNYVSFGWADYGDNSAESFYGGAMPALVLRSLAEDGVYDPREMNLPPDRVRLYVFAKLPDDHFVDTTTHVQKDGRILYVCDIPLRGGARPAPPDTP